MKYVVGCLLSLVLIALAASRVSVQPPVSASIIAPVLVPISFSLADGSQYDADGDGILDQIDIATGLDLQNPIFASLQITSGADASLLWSHIRGDANDLFADIVIVSADHNGDAIEDLFVTAPRVGMGTDHIGRVYLLSGSSGAIIREFVGPTDILVGMDAAVIGDQSNDGIDDLLVEGGYVLSSGDLQPQTLLYSTISGQLLARFHAPLDSVLDRVTQGHSLYLQGDTNFDSHVNSVDLYDFMDAYIIGDLEVADLDRDGWLTATDLVILIANYGDSAAFSDYAIEEATSTLAVWNATYPESVATGYSDGESPEDDCCDGCPLAPEPDCWVAIVNCPAGIMPIGEEFIIYAQAGPEPINGDFCWSVSDNVTLLSGTNGNQIHIRTNASGPVDICVKYETPDGCIACDTCEFEIADCFVTLSGCTDNPYTRIWHLVADGVPPGGSYSWSFLSGGSLIEYSEVSQNGEQFYLVANGGYGTIVVEVKYTIGNCVATESCSLTIGPAPDDADGDGLDDNIDPCDDNPDCDDDGFGDLCEYLLGSDLEDPNSIPDLGRDQDMDGLSDVEELCYGLGTNYLKFDTDGDGVQDLAEVELAAIGLAFNPLWPDTDGNGIRDGDEFVYSLFDMDADGLYDEYEREMGWDPTDADQNNNGVDDGTDTGGGDPPDGGDDGADIDDLIELYCSDGSFDSDSDGLCNELEDILGTDPNNFDSDSDGLPDLWELQNGLDPLSRDSDGDGIPDGQEDEDGDGLNNWDEYAYGTDPNNPDTDGDGTSDGDEANQGSDPNDGDDNGEAPPPSEVVEIELQVGDHSGSESERWQLNVGPIQHKGRLGEVTPPKRFKLRKGRIHKITLTHLGSNRNPPNHDWTAHVSVITPGGGVVIDPDILLGEHWSTEPPCDHHDQTCNPAATRVAWLILGPNCDHTFKEDIDIRIAKPLVIDPATPILDASEECTLGVQTFVNLDNDDEDDFFDIDDDDGVEDDNELVRIEVHATGDLPEGTVTISSTTTHVRYWQDKDKKSEYLPIAAPFAYPDDFASGPQELWIEAIEADTETRETIIFARYTAAEVPDLQIADTVAMTIIGIESLEWVGVGNAVDDGNVLDTDPNWPPGIEIEPGVPLDSYRVFPGARYDAGSIEPDPRHTVQLKVRLTAKPAEPISLSLDSFDTDDPFSDADPLDDEALVDDNRGTTIDPTGEFNGETAGILTLDVSNKETLVPFRVTMQPGDNFRVVINGDRKFIEHLEQDDSSLGTDNSDKQRVLNSDTPPTGDPVDREIRSPESYASPVLTVWRMLYLEVDTMLPVLDNYVGLEIVSLNTGDSSTATAVFLESAFADNSKNLDNGPDTSGRFDSGTIRVAGTHDIVNLDGNGNQHVQRMAGLDVCATALPFTAENAAGSVTMSGSVSLINGAGRVCHVSGVTFNPPPPPSDWAGWVGGTMSIGGGSDMALTGADMSTLTLTIAADALRIPMRIVDDDTPDGTAIPRPNTSDVARAFARGYVLPQEGTLPGEDSLPFIANIQTRTGPLDDGWAFTNEADHDLPRFWIAYIRGAYQDDTSTDDRDPDSEGVTWGIAEQGYGLGSARGLNVYWEAHAETIGEVPPNLPGYGFFERDTVVHELGHLFGCWHDEAGIMGDDTESDFDSIEFSDDSLLHIRSAIAP